MICAGGCSLASRIRAKKQVKWLYPNKESEAGQLNSINIMTDSSDILVSIPGPEDNPQSISHTDWTDNQLLRWCRAARHLHSQFLTTALKILFDSRYMIKIWKFNNVQQQANSIAKLVFPLTVSLYCTWTNKKCCACLKTPKPSSTTYCAIDACEQFAIELHHRVNSSFHLLLSYGL